MEDAVHTLTRRGFLLSSSKKLLKGATVAALGGVGSKRVMGANDKVVLALVGCGGRGLQVLKDFSKRSDVLVSYLCDLNEERGKREFEDLKQQHNSSLKKVKEYQRILDDKSVDAVIVATPDHWHSPLSIYCCQAGKDVYVEKPPSHNVWEGRKVVEAARKYDRVVQVGTQNRSASYVRSALEYIRAGKLGTLHLCKVFNHVGMSPQKLGPDSDPPNGFDWNTWLGPAPRRPYNRAIFNGKWHDYWAYSGGTLADDGVHQMDLARLLVQKDYFKSVYSSGGNFVIKNDRDVPDTQLITYDFGDLILTYDQACYQKYMTKTAPSIRYSRDKFPYWMTNATRIELYGTDGLMMMGRHGGGWQVFTKDGEIVAQEGGYFPDEEHQENFINCLRSRKLPNGDIEEGHRSAVMVHAANISLMLGSRKLSFDRTTETFVNDDEANKLLKRTYRKPFEVSERV